MTIGIQSWDCLQFFIYFFLSLTLGEKCRLRSWPLHSVGNAFLLTLYWVWTVFPFLFLPFASFLLLAKLAPCLLNFHPSSGKPIVIAFVLTSEHAQVTSTKRLFGFLLSLFDSIKFLILFTCWFCSEKNGKKRSWTPHHPCDLFSHRPSHFICRRHLFFHNFICLSYPPPFDAYTLLSYHHRFHSWLLSGKTRSLRWTLHLITLTSLSLLSHNRSSLNHWIGHFDLFTFLNLLFWFPITIRSPTILLSSLIIYRLGL